MSSRPLILLVNDDGYLAPGIRALATEFKDFAEVLVIAPDRERSAQSQAITITDPLRASEVEDGVIAVSGTPADCVMYALQQHLDRQPDWVISGINHGGNLGTDILYSGTVGAAMEACVSGCRAMAVSLEGVRSKPWQYEMAAKVTRKIIENADSFQLTSHELLNVNIPNLPREEIKGMVTASVGRRYYEGKMSERQCPRGKKYYWIGGNDAAHDDIPGSDCVLLADGYITVSVLQSSFYAENATQRLAETITKIL